MSKGRGIIKGLEKIINKVFRENKTPGAAFRQARELIPADELKGNNSLLRDKINEKFEKAGPKAEVKKERMTKVEKDSAEKQAREKDTPQTDALVKLGDAMRAKPKRDFEATKTSEEAGRSAARVAGGMRIKEQKGMQAAYNKKKAEVAWLKANDPKSPLIADRQAEMTRLRQRGSINTGVKVEPVKPPEAREQVRKQKKEAQLEADTQKFLDALNKRKPKMNKGGQPNKNKKVPVVAVSVGMVSAPKTGKGKAQMAKGGMAYGKPHMYLAGGGVTMNPGLKALKKASPEAFNKITKNA